MVIISHVLKHTHKSCCLIGYRNLLIIFPAAREVKIVKKLEDVEVMEKENAAFVCEVSHDEVECQWYKGSTKLKVGDNIKMRQEGKVSKKLYSYVYTCIHMHMIYLNNDYLHIVLFLIPGKTYVLLFKSVTIEDMGEIKFTADKASSAAKLKVKGKPVRVMC